MTPFLAIVFTGIAGMRPVLPIGMQRQLDLPMMSTAGRDRFPFSLRLSRRRPNDNGSPDKFVTVRNPRLTSIVLRRRQPPSQRHFKPDTSIGLWSHIDITRNLLATFRHFDESGFTFPIRTPGRQARSQRLTNGDCESLAVANVQKARTAAFFFFFSCSRGGCSWSLFGGGGGTSRRQRTTYFLFSRATRRISVIAVQDPTTTTTAAAARRA